MGVAEKYIDKIKKKGLSNRQLAIKAGVEPNHMSMIKKGDRPMPEALIMQISEVLQIDPAIIDIELLAEKRHGTLKGKLLNAVKKFVIGGAVVTLSTLATPSKDAIAGFQSDLNLTKDIYYTQLYIRLID